MAVVNHLGGMGSGHYTADCFCTSDQRWHHFNDTHVTPTSADRLNGSTAYVLFYVRREL